MSPSGIERSIVTRADIDKTKTGHLLMIIGVILSAVPFLPYVGFVFVVLGIVLIWLGRDPFGDKHSSYVKSSIILVIIGIVIAYLTTQAAVSYVSQPILNGQNSPFQFRSVISVFDAVLFGLFISGILVGIAYVFLTFDLQDPSGRFVLYVAFTAQLAVEIIVAYVLSGILTSATSSPTFPFGTFDPSQLQGSQSQLKYLELSSLFPAFFFAGAFYRIYSRLNNGDLPERSQPLSTAGPRWREQ